MISNIGSFNYKETANAGTYAISSVDFNDLALGKTTENISYTAFDKIKQLSHINGNGILNGKIEISYGLDQQRLYQTTTLENGTIKEKYFIGGLYEKEICDGTTKELCYISTPAGTVAIKQTENNIDTWLFLTHDHLGSVHCILNEDGSLEQELSFDPYGNRRDPNTWKPFEEGQEPTYLLDRGYTFHEHWDDFDLINMNGRVYDPVIARFLSPDPYVQSPGYSQNFNRYSYVLNNPLRYTDPSGENPLIIAAILVAGVYNMAANVENIKSDNDALKYFAVGGVAGLASAGTGTVAAGLVGGVGFASGALVGGAAGFAGGFTTGTGNAMIGGASFYDAFHAGMTTGAVSGLVGSAVGGVVGGLNSSRYGGDFWTGDGAIYDYMIPSGETKIGNNGSFQFKNDKELNDWISEEGVDLDSYNTEVSAYADNISNKKYTYKRNSKGILYKYSRKTGLKIGQVGGFAQHNSFGVFSNRSSSITMSRYADIKYFSGILNHELIHAYHISLGLPQAMNMRSFKNYTEHCAYQYMYDVGIESVNRALIYPTVRSIIMPPNLLPTL